MTAELVEFPNVTLWVTGYLRSSLASHGYAGVRVADTYKGTDQEVWVQRDGGPVLNVAWELARIRINVFAKGDTNQAVDDLARRVSTLMRACADESPVVRVEQITGPSPIPDTLPRRYLLFELTIRGEALP